MANENNNTKNKNQKQSQRQNRRPELSAEEKKIRKDARLVSLRSEAIVSMTDFMGKTTESEVRSLLAYVTAKNAHMAAQSALKYEDKEGRNQAMADRLGKVQAISLTSDVAAEILATLPIIDAVMANYGKELQNIATQSGSSMEDGMNALKEIQEFKDSLEEIQGKLLPMIDVACDKGLVRDYAIVEDYRARKAVEKQMISLGIDPTSKDAHEQLEKVKAEKRAETLKKEEEEKAEKQRLKDEQLAIEKEAQEANIALMKVLGIDPESSDAKKLLKSAKFDLKKFDIDSKAKDVLKQLTKKREEITVLAQDAEQTA